MTVSLRPPESVIPVPTGPCAAVPGLRHVGVVVVMHVVVHEHPARVRVGDRADRRCSGRPRSAGPAGHRRSGCWCRSRPGCCRTREFSMTMAPAGVGPGVAEGAVLHPRVVDRHVAHLQAGADVHAGVVEVARVELVPEAGSLRVGGEDAVLRSGFLVAEVGRGRREVAPGVAVQADLAGVGAAVPPHLVAAVVGTAEEVADGEVLDADAVGLPDQDAVATGCLARLRPSRPNCWALGSAAARAEPGLVPSTTTPERFIPRRCRFGLVM